MCSNETGFLCGAHCHPVLRHGYHTNVEAANQPGIPASCGQRDGRSHHEPFAARVRAGSQAMGRVCLQQYAPIGGACKSSVVSVDEKRARCINNDALLQARLSGSGRRRRLGQPVRGTRKRRNAAQVVLIIEECASSHHVPAWRPARPVGVARERAHGEAGDRNAVPLRENNLRRGTPADVAAGTEATRHLSAAHLRLRLRDCYSGQVTVTDLTGATAAISRTQMAQPSPELRHVVLSPGFVRHHGHWWAGEVGSCPRPRAVIPEPRSGNE